MSEEDTGYECGKCGEDWDGEATAFYVEGKCANCGAAGGIHKVKKDD